MRTLCCRGVVFKQLSLSTRFFLNLRDLSGNTTARKLESRSGIRDQTRRSLKTFLGHRYLSEFYGLSDSIRRFFQTLIMYSSCCINTLLYIEVSAGHQLYTFSMLSKKSRASLILKLNE